MSAKRSNGSGAAHEHFMRLALREAVKGLGRTHPNPAVGAVLVKHGRVIASGYHERAGAPHAEAVALKRAGARAKGATLYTTLEPCDHTGRTPPCTAAILAAGVARVVYASADPNPLVDGKGLKRLKRQGVQVEGPVLAADADALNRPFLSLMRSGRPWVTLKAGVSLDGKLATGQGDSKWITSDAARERAHRLRNVVDAIIVGAGTVEADDPALTTRLPEGGGRTPVRVILDPQLRTNPRARVYQASPDGDRPRARRTKPEPVRLNAPESPALRSPARPAVVVAARPPRARLAAFERAGVEVWQLPAGRRGVDLQKLLVRLGAEGLLHVLVEGGARTHAAFLAQHLADEVALFVAPRLLGHEGLTWSGPLGVRSVAEALTVTELSASPLDDGLLVTARLRPVRA